MNIFAWIGMITLFLFALSVSLLVLAYLAGKVYAWHGTIVDKEANKQIRELGGKIKSAAWWFSEDENSMIVLQILGDKLVNMGDFNVTSIRDEWRESKKRDADGK